ncbi:glutamine synthetase family protein [Cyclobacterium qasimii]|nr:glutamine synthetase family protein [Cyclobacterium qasimii]EPR71650.1 glutamine synthetase family protein [Cyclobacterium qasimii M12-11B]GEO22435.1 glutamine synthetase [Cyclobacterium qasimii]
MKLSKEEVKSSLKNSSFNKVKLAIVDIDGVLRGKVVSLEKFFSILDGGMGFCAVVFGWDVEDKSYDNVSVTGWHTGYPDFHAEIDPATFRKIPWENDLPFFLADFSKDKENGALVCPRTLLKNIKQQALDLGFTPQFSQEFEWFNFESTPDGFGGENCSNTKPLTPGMFGYSILRSSLKSAFFNDLFDLCHQFDIPLEGLHTETGPGVYEAAIQYSDILLAADRAALFKTSVKEIAYQHGIMATFMAKWTEDLPGNGGHVHQSIWDKDVKNNLFYDPKGEFSMSPLMRHYIAGQLKCLPHILPMFAPTINSYKRLVEGAWAPTTLTWAQDNRTTALRILSGGAKSTRLETRVIGSDVNPYLAMSACLASGLYGIQHKLELDKPATVGNGYEDYSNGSIPTSLKEATEAMKNSAIAKSLFGEVFVDHFCKTREWECREFASKVTDWERKRYFEII